MKTASAIVCAAMAMAAFPARADRVVRHSDGAPIRVRVERKAGARPRAKAAGAADGTAAILANWGVSNPAA